MRMILEHYFVSIEFKMLMLSKNKIYCHIIRYKKIEDIPTRLNILSSFIF
jgi:hypothetical protein